MPTARAGGPADLSRSASQPEALIAIAKLCEAAPKSDRDIDYAIVKAVGYADGRPYSDVDGWRMPLFFSSSIDAAITLVPKGCFWAGGDHPDLGAAMTVTNIAGSLPQAAKAATPALALCAAALRARAAQ